MACADFRHHMKIAHIIGLNIKLAISCAERCDTKKYRYLPYRPQCNDRYVSSVGASTKIRNGFKSLVLSQVRREYSCFVLMR
jgi:hypothetical protein